MKAKAVTVRTMRITYVGERGRGELDEPPGVRRRARVDDDGVDAADEDRGLPRDGTRMLTARGGISLVVRCTADAYLVVTGDGAAGTTRAGRQRGSGRRRW